MKRTMNEERQDHKRQKTCTRYYTRTNLSFDEVTYNIMQLLKKHDDTHGLEPRIHSAEDIFFYFIEHIDMFREYDNLMSTVEGKLVNLYLQGMRTAPFFYKQIFNRDMPF